MSGLYFHFPFCRSKCDYCDYNSYPGIVELLPTYIEALIKEIEKSHALFKEREVKTIYFGGGTPSILSGEQVKKLTSIIDQSFDMAQNIEFTIECNPRDIDLKKINSYLESGINRISLGVQSFQDRLLKNIGRRQTGEEAVQAVEILKNFCFPNFNIDLIYGLPNQTDSKWQSDLKKVVEFEPNHISIYPLTILKKSPLAIKIEEGKVPGVNEDVQADFYLNAINFLTEFGYKQYEISNFAQPGYKCQHNLIYWQQEDYLGFGAGAHSHLQGKRWANVSKPEEYIAAVNQDKKTVCFEENLTEEERLSEYLILNLRLIDGLDEYKINERFRTNFRKKFQLTINKLSDLELIEDKGQIRLTSKGKLLANDVFREFI